MVVIISFLAITIFRAACSVNANDVYSLILWKLQLLIIIACMTKSVYAIWKFHRFSHDWLGVLRGLLLDQHVLRFVPSTYLIQLLVNNMRTIILVMWPSPQSFQQLISVHLVDKVYPQRCLRTSLTRRTPQIEPLVGNVTDDQEAMRSLTEGIIPALLEGFSRQKVRLVAK